MATVELSNFPEWTELEDLKAVVDFTGHGDAEVSVRRNTKDPTKSVAIAEFGTAAAAAAAALQLNGFEFTPGYPLEARAVAATRTGPPARPAQAAGRPPAAPTPAKAGAVVKAKGGGKGGGKSWTTAKNEGTEEDPDYPVKNCVDAGLIEGWFGSARENSEIRGWGFVQSYSFAGNLIFRPCYSPLLREGSVDYKPKDSCTFEVVLLEDGSCVAVNVCVPGQDPVEPGSGERPWNDLIQYKTDCYVEENREWLKRDGEVLLRCFDPEDREFIFDQGPMQGCRDPRKVMFARINNKRVELGMPYVQAKAKENYTEEEWAAWNDLSGESKKRKSEHSQIHGEGRDMTWGNETGTGVFFAGLTPEMDELALQAYAENAGIVTFVKIFHDSVTGEHKGCGKVFYQTTDMANHAVATLNRTELNGKWLKVQILGTDAKKKKTPHNDIDLGTSGLDGPRLLPLSYFDGTDSDEQKMELCYAAFEDLLENHDPVSTGKGHVFMVRSLVREINQVFDGNNEAKQAFAWRLGKHPWFRANEQAVKWQTSRSLIQISKISAENLEYKMKGKGKGKGKDEDAPSNTGNPWEKQSSW